MKTNKTIYFDNASTSFPKPQRVIEKITHYFNDVGASPGRGGYPQALKAYELIEDIRHRIAGLLDVENPAHVVFTHNATHAANIVLKGLLKEGDHVIISNFEHNAIYRPLHHLKMEKGISYDIWESDLSGTFDIEVLNKLIKPNTKLIVLNHASNVLGVLAPIEKIGRFANEKKIAILIDVAQTAGLFPTAFGKFADYIVGTGHKSLLGPPGVGFLYVKNEETITSLYQGGSGNLSTSPYQPETLPDKFEAGTCNYLGIAGLKGGLEYLDEIGQEKTKNDLLNYTKRAIEMLKSIPEAIIYGPETVENKVPLISFNLTNCFPGEIGYILQENLICVRTGIQCAPLMHKTLKTLPLGTVRLSFGHLNTDEEINVLHDCLTKYLQKKEL